MRSETLEDLGERAQTRPRAPIAHGGRAEGREVAKDQRVRFALRTERTPQPSLDGGTTRLPTGSPGAARRNLDQRHEIADGRRERVRIASRPSLGQERT